MTGNPSLDKIILGINGIIVVAAAALVVYSHTAINPPVTDPNSEFGAMIENSMNEYEKPPIILKEIVVNLYSKERRLRFLNTVLNLDLFREQDREMVTNLTPFIFDLFIDITGNMKPKELNSITGRILLESRLKKQVNRFARKPVIKKIYFSKYIIQ